MTIVTLEVPENEVKNTIDFIKEKGGVIISIDGNEVDEVTHEQYFGENIKRAVKAFYK